MAKITQVTIIDENTLRLEVDAIKGDEIDLLSLKTFDTSSLRKKIEEGKDNEYQKYLIKEQEKFKLELSNALIQEANRIKNEYEQKIHQQKIECEKIKIEKEQLANSIEDKASLKANEEVVKYQNKINELESELLKNSQAYKIEVLNLQNELKTLQLSINNEIQNAQIQKQIELKTQEQNYLEKIHVLENSHNVAIMEKDNEILRLKNDRTSLNIKRIGEDLERWCNNEFEAYAHTGFLTSTWEKDNLVVKHDGESKGTKADFIFKVYDNENHDQLITSVACEMKSEDINSKNKKKNSDHYAKLDHDRKNKKCEYALLISELEWDQSNDIPIKRVREYDNMYVVRPQYFITFLSVIESLAKKYQSLVIDNKIDSIKFEESLAIIEEFEKFKNDLLNVSISRIAGAVEDINKQAKAINSAANFILDRTSVIVNSHIQAMINKINKYDIKKITKSIDKLEK